MPDNLLNIQSVGLGIAAIIAAACIYFSYFALPKQMERAYKDALYTLAAAVETKDSGTIGHARRVADYAVAVASSLGVSKNELRIIEYAALLRDIGKVNVPHALLNKTGPLTDEEWIIMKSHSTLGAEMVSTVPFLADTADLILHHHENWDGSGYPEGLRGEEIPLGSRILAIATDYDAMVSNRPYHQAMQPEQALEIIKNDIGIKYDPKVAEVFLNFINGKTQKAA